MRVPPLNKMSYEGRIHGQNVEDEERNDIAELGLGMLRL